MRLRTGVAGMYTRIIAPSIDGTCNNYEKVRAARRTSLE